ncbi:hypothetical protein GCM10018952_61470 [Streptosporangium vulgare]
MPALGHPQLGAQISRPSLAGMLGTCPAQMQVAGASAPGSRLAVQLTHGPPAETRPRIEDHRHPGGAVHGPYPAQQHGTLRESATVST